MTEEQKEIFKETCEKIVEQDGSCGDIDCASSCPFSSVNNGSDGEFSCESFGFSTENISSSSPDLLLKESAEKWLSDNYFKMDTFFPEILPENSSDNVKHPSHYADTVPGIECIQVTQHFNFNRGNAIKYIWRAGHKNDEVEDLKKALQYIEFEIKRLEGVK